MLFQPAPRKGLLNHSHRLVIYLVDDELIFWLIGCLIFSLLTWVISLMFAVDWFVFKVDLISWSWFNGTIT